MDLYVVLGLGEGHGAGMPTGHAAAAFGYAPPWLERQRMALQVLWVRISVLDDDQVLLEAPSIGDWCCTVDDRPVVRAFVHPWFGDASVEVMGGIELPSVQLVLDALATVLGMGEAPIPLPPASSICAGVVCTLVAMVARVNSMSDADREVHFREPFGLPPREERGLKVPQAVVVMETFGNLASPSARLVPDAGHVWGVFQRERRGQATSAETMTWSTVTVVNAIASMVQYRDHGRQFRLRSWLVANCVCPNAEAVLGLWPRLLGIGAGDASGECV